jgi:hypothetical protein
MLIESAVHWKTSEFLMKQKRVKWGGLRWISQDGTRYYEWDSLHGEIEVYNKKGEHFSVLSADGKSIVKKPEKGRRIDV